MKNKIGKGVWNNKNKKVAYDHLQTILRHMVEVPCWYVQ